MTLRVLQIFHSIQGESTRAGRPCAFVRLAGCTIGCAWCDTPEAQPLDAGRDMDAGRVAAELLGFGLPLAEITGGEPLLQREGVGELAARLLDARLTVMLETSGCLPLGDLDPRIEVIMDVKTPSSNVADKLCPANLPLLRGNDEVKFVIADRTDYQWSCRFLAEHDLSAVRAVHFSPAWEQLDPRTLAGWMRSDPPPAPVRLTVQLHKLLGVP